MQFFIISILSKSELRDILSLSVTAERESIKLTYSNSEEIDAQYLHIIGAENQ